MINDSVCCNHTHLPHPLQVYITAVGNEFDFLNEFEYKYEQSSSEGETPGPFTRSFQALDAELEEREEDRSGDVGCECGWSLVDRLWRLSVNFSVLSFIF